MCSGSFLRDKKVLAQRLCPATEGPPLNALDEVGTFLPGEDIEGPSPIALKQFPGRARGVGSGVQATTACQEQCPLWGPPMSFIQIVTPLTKSGKQ